MPEIDVHRLFDRVAHLYDMGWLQRALYLAVQDRALAELRAFRPGSVLDVGCGTGIFATRIDQELTAAAVAGCDISAECWPRRPAAAAGSDGCGATPPVSPSGAAGWRRWCPPRPSTSSTKPAAWAEFRRVLAPGGHALVGMMHPRTEAGSRRFTRLSTATAKTRVAWPTRAEMRRMATDAGFEIAAQHEVEWRFRRIAPLILTVGRAPAAQAPSSTSQDPPRPV